MTRGAPPRPRPRLTRRGRTVVAGLAVVVVAVAVAALDGGDAGLEAPGLTAGAAVEVPGPSPSPTGPSWSPADPEPLVADLEVVDTLVAAAPVVVVADVRDRLDRDAATWLAAQLQAPLVAGEAPVPTAAAPEHPAPAPDVPPGTEVLVAVGDVAVPDDVEVLRVTRAGDVEPPETDPRAGVLQVRRVERVAAAEEPPVALHLDEVADLLEEATVGAPSGATLLARPRGLDVATVATAVALGHRVVVTDATDPRAADALRDALGDGPVALAGEGWDPAAVAGWHWKLAVVRRGLEVPGGGQLVFPGRMIVALYGHPDGPALGVLGEQPLAATIDRARQQAAAYDALVEEPVVPALEIIATVASAASGPRGDYSRRTDVEQLRPYVDAAREAGVFVVLDLQPGRTDFLSQAREYEELLREPHVGLALDPEWRLGPDERHLVRIGSVGADEVNAVVDWLADLTRTEALPQKLLVLHQFSRSMLRERERIDTSRDELAMVLHVDGQGGQPAKLATYASMLRDLQPEVWIGWKNFHDEDRPMRSEAETVALDPRPVFVTYQ